MLSVLQPALSQGGAAINAGTYRFVTARSLQDVGIRDEVFQRDWPDKWSFRRKTEASLCGLGKLGPREG